MLLCLTQTGLAYCVHNHSSRLRGQSFGNLTLSVHKYKTWKFEGGASWKISCTKFSCPLLRFYFFLESALIVRSCLFGICLSYSLLVKKFSLLLMRWGRVCLSPQAPRCRRAWEMKPIHPPTRRFSCGNNPNPFLLDLFVSALVPSDPLTFTV